MWRAYGSPILQSIGLTVLSKMSEHHVDLTELAKARDGTGHSIFSPSSSQMWLHCAGSLIPNILAKDDAGEDAAYGTVAHSVSEVWLKARAKPWHLLGRKEFIPSGDWGFLITIDEEMFAYVEASVERCLWLPGDHLVEQKADFSRLTPIPRQTGTMDFAAMRPGELDVTDHKYGSSPENIVYAERNSQGMLYALGIYYRWDWAYDFQKITIRINQPRLDHFDEWTCTREELLEFAGYVRERAAQAWHLDAPRNPSPKACRFCKVKSTCAAFAKVNVELTEGVFNIEPQTDEDMNAFKRRLMSDIEDFAPQFADVNSLSTDQLVKLLPYRGASERWWESLEEELKKRAMVGMGVGQFKLVESKTHRKFKNIKSALAFLESKGIKRSDLVKESYVSPAQAEVLLMKAGVPRADLPKALADHVVKPRGLPTLAPLSDRRPAYVDPTEAVFSDSTENPETEEL